MKIFSVNYDLLIQAENAQEPQEAILKHLKQEVTVTEVEIPTLEDYIRQVKEGYWKQDLFRMKLKIK